MVGGGRFEFRALGMYWPAAAALALAAIVALILHPDTPAQRLVNLHIVRAEIPDTYIMFSKSEAGRCFVTDRRDSTMRRDDAGMSGRKWDCESFTTGGGPAEAWIVRSKREGKGTVLFIPVADVPDWSYPFLYAFVRERRPDLDLPAAGWTQLHLNRIYRGLFLRVALPFDARKKDGGSGVLREILTVRGDAVTRLDTRFYEAFTLYVDAVAAARLPGLRREEALAWLAARCPAPPTFLMSNLPPHEATLLPLPVSLPELFRALHGRTPSAFEDRRVAEWTLGWGGGGVAPPFGAREMADLRRAFADYERAFVAALESDARLRRDDARVRMMPARRGSVDGLGLTPAGS